MCGIPYGVQRIEASKPSPFFLAASAGVGAARLSMARAGISSRPRRTSSQRTRGGVAAAGVVPQTIERSLPYENVWLAIQLVEIGRRQRQRAVPPQPALEDRVDELPLPVGAALGQRTALEPLE